MQRDPVARPWRAIRRHLGQVAKIAVGKLGFVQVLMDGFVHQSLGAHEHAIRGRVDVGKHTTANNRPVRRRRGTFDGIRLASKRRLHVRIDESQCLRRFRAHQARDRADDRAHLIPRLGRVVCERG